MHDMYADLEELCGAVSKELEKVTDKISRSGSLSSGDLEIADKLTHTLKSIKTTMAMIEAEDGYSGDDRMGGSYASARGRMNAPRDSRGRYSGNYGRMPYYSRDDGMISELRDLMQNVSDDRTRQEFQKFISKIESM